VTERMREALRPSGEGTDGCESARGGSGALLVKRSDGSAKETGKGITEVAPARINAMSCDGSAALGHPCPQCGPGGDVWFIWIPPAIIVPFPSV
jgi:hypothetical protein